MPKSAVDLHPPLPTHRVEDEINANLSMQTGFDIRTVEFLRTEFKKLGRNPRDTDVEFIAIENGHNEQQVKNLHDLHIAHVRRLDGFSNQKTNY